MLRLNLFGILALPLFPFRKVRKCRKARAVRRLQREWTSPARTEIPSRDGVPRIRFKFGRGKFVTVHVRCCGDPIRFELRDGRNYVVIDSSDLGLFSRVRFIMDCGHHAA